MYYLYIVFGDNSYKMIGYANTVFGDCTDILKEFINHFLYFIKKS